VRIPEFWTYSPTSFFGYIPDKLPQYCISNPSKRDFTFSSAAGPSAERFSVELVHRPHLRSSRKTLIILPPSLDSTAMTKVPVFGRAIRTHFFQGQHHASFSATFSLEREHLLRGVSRIRPSLFSQPNHLQQQSRAKARKKWPGKQQRGKSSQPARTKAFATFSGAPAQKQEA
jgi:hypothetical protein